MHKNQINSENKIKEIPSSHEFLIDFYNKSPDMMCVFGLDGYVKQVNPAFTIITGFKEEELVGEHYCNFIKKSDRQLVSNEFTKLNQGITTLKFIIQVKCKDGNFKWISWSGYPSEGGLIYAIGKDITDDKKALENLNYQKEIFEAIFDHIPLLVTFYNSQGKVLAVNKELKRVLGWDIEGSNRIDVIKKNYPIKQQRTEAINFTKQTTPSWKEFEVQTKSGKPVTISWYNIPLSDGSCLSIGRDITEQKKIDEVKKEFLAAVSHELKTPITTLKLMCESFRIRYPLQNKKNSPKDFLIIKSELDRLTRLIDDLLDFSRFENGKLSFRFEAIHLDELIGNIITKMRQLSVDHKLILECKEEVEILVDAHRIEQVLVNLITNAFKYSPNGKKVEISCIKQEKEVIISVKDYGLGIPKSKQKYIFDRFYQVNKSQHIGFGLGLYISKEIIERHKGKIWVESEQGKGSTFYFTLPMLQLRLQPF